MTQRLDLAIRVLGLFLIAVGLLAGGAVLALTFQPLEQPEPWRAQSLQPSTSFGLEPIATTTTTSAVPPPTGPAWPAELTAADVEAVQAELAERGYPVGVDGIWGDWTEEAVREFQTDLFLDVTGRVDELTWLALFPNEGVSE